MKIKMALVNIHANDPDEHSVHWMPSTKSWSLFKGSELVREYFHLCDALTGMHIRTAAHSYTGIEYRDILVKKWTVNK